MILDATTGYKPLSTLDRCGLRKGCAERQKRRNWHVPIYRTPRCCTSQRHKIPPTTTPLTIPVADYRPTTNRQIPIALRLLRLH